MRRERLQNHIRPWLALAALASAIAGSTPAGATTQEIRLASPVTTGRAPTQGRLPGPLGARDADLYRRIFALQEAGDFDAADRLIAGLGDPLLLGHVQLQRYLHPTAYRSSFAELASWLEAHGDHPDADRAYRLAVKRRPRGAPAPAAPLRGYLSGNGQQLQEIGRPRHDSHLERSPAEDAMVRDWQREIDRLTRSGRPDDAVARLHDPAVIDLIDPIEGALAKWTVAQGYFAAGRDAAAETLASQAAERAAERVPEIHWTAGISAWRRGAIHRAAEHFAILAEAEAALPAERARGAFWAARAAIVLFRPQLVGHYLEVAAGHRQSFYGLLASAALGRPIAYDGEVGNLQDHVSGVLLRLPGARRALGLAQIGRTELAEKEIRKLAARVEPEVMVGLIALAKSLDLPAVQMRLAQSLSYRDTHHGGLYPLPSWQPARGFTLDRALLYAVVRAESAFDPTAESHAGARGLMQIMPATASYIARQSPLALARQDDLFQPETSMSFGQWYLEYLLQNPRVGDNLVFMAVAYNAGPGRAAQWRAELGHQHDPLLFLESIPLREPRVYVKKVLSNFWSYRARLGQPQPSLRALAHNRWPSYRALDRERQVHAWN